MKKNKNNKRLIVVLCGAYLAFLSSCVYDVSKVSPHAGLIGTVWILKQDAYVVKYDDSNDYIAIPCRGEVADFFLPDGTLEYNRRQIGFRYRSLTIVGGLKTGDAVKINKVLKDSNPELGTIYKPVGYALGSSTWGDERGFNMEFYYSLFGSTPNGLLDGRYALIKSSRPIRLSGQALQKSISQEPAQ